MKQCVRARGGRHWQPINGRERKEEEKKLVCFAQESSELAQCVWVFCTQFTLINFHSGRPSQTYKESFKIKLPRFVNLILIYFRRKMQFQGCTRCYSSFLQYMICTRATLKSFSVSRRGQRPSIKDGGKIYAIFDSSLTVGHFSLLSIGKFDRCFTPSP